MVVLMSDRLVGSEYKRTIPEIEGWDFHFSGEGDGGGGAALKASVILQRPKEDEIDRCIKVRSEDLLAVAGVELP